MRNIDICRSSNIVSKQTKLTQEGLVSVKTESVKFRTLGEAVRTLREKRQMSLRALAEKIGVSAPFLSDLEHDRRKTDKLREISEALAVDLQVLEELDPRISDDLKQWFDKNPGLVSVLKEWKASGQPVPLQDLKGLMKPPPR
jgi:transcriptional regulator with XRE-family HTH domain